MRLAPLHFLVGCCLAISASGLGGAVFELTNGDRLTGEIVAREPQVVVIQTALAGQVRVPYAALATPLPDPPPPAATPEPKPKPVAPNSPEKPPQPTNTDQAAPPGDPAAEFAEAQSMPTPPDQQQERRHRLSDLPSDAYHAWMRIWEDNLVFRTLARIYPLMDWDNSIEVGFSLDYGSDDEENLDVRFNSRRRVDKHQTRLQLHYELDQLSQSDQPRVKTRDWLRASVTYRYDYFKAVFAQTSTRYNRRLEKEIRHQFDELLGVGYRWLDNERMEGSLTPSAGFGYREIGSDEPEWNWLVSLQQDFSITVTDQLKWTQEALVTYEFTEGGEFGALFRSGLENRLTTSLSLHVRYEFTYDESIEAELERTSQGIHFSLGAKF